MGKGCKAVRAACTMGVSQIIRTDDSITIVTDDGHSSTRDQSSNWNDSQNNEILDEAIEEALRKMLMINYLEGD